MEPSLPVKADRAGVKPDARRKRAILAAHAIASEGGYDALTMLEVARRSGVSRATLYRYFSSKDHLLIEVSLDANAQLQEDLEARPPKGSTVADRITETFTRMLEMVAGEPKLLDATLRAYFADDPVIRSLVSELRRYGGVFVNAGLGASIPQAVDIARVLDPLSLALAIGISSGRRSLEESIDDLRRAVHLLVKE